jgi:hypothetical protein
MKSYVTSPRVVTAVQWFKNGDHPNDNCQLVTMMDEIKGPSSFLSEGLIVRYYRSPNPDRAGNLLCRKCSLPYHEHGLLDKGSHCLMVCPGDFIVHTHQTCYPLCPTVFNRKFIEVIETVEDSSYCGSSPVAKLIGQELLNIELKKDIIGSI